MDLLDDFLANRLQVVCQETDGRLRFDAPRPRLLLSGSFNPLHEGHCELARVAAGLRSEPVAFEMTVCNADKPPLGEEEVRARMKAFVGLSPLWLTRAPTFAAKADLFPGARFVVGADTAVRILDARFYGNDPALLEAALSHLRRRDCRFLVAGRLAAKGRFCTLVDLSVPVEIQDLFEEIPAATFRRDISSTQMRSLGCPLTGPAERARP